MYLSSEKPYYGLISSPVRWILCSAPQIRDTDPLCASSQLPLKPSSIALRSFTFFPNGVTAPVGTIVSIPALSASSTYADDERMHPLANRNKFDDGFRFEVLLTMTMDSGRNIQASWIMSRKPGWSANYGIMARPENKPIGSAKAVVALVVSAKLTRALIRGTPGVYRRARSPAR